MSFGEFWELLLYFPFFHSFINFINVNETLFFTPFPTISLVELISSMPVGKSEPPPNFYNTFSLNALLVNRVKLQQEYVTTGANMQLFYFFQHSTNIPLHRIAQKKIFYFELNTACWKSTMLPASFSTSCIEWLQADVSQSFQVEDLTNSLMITLQEIWTLLPTEQVPWRTFSNRN